MTINMNAAYLEYRLSGGAANADPDASLGGDLSSERILSQSTSALSNITGVTIDYASGNPTGNGTLAFTFATKFLTWTPNGLSAGAAVDITNSGKYAVFGEAGVLLITVVAGSLPGTNQNDTVTIAHIKNEVFDNVAKAESFAGDTEYRCIYAKNTATANSITSITRSGSTAHVTTGSAHGYTTGEEVTIMGAVQPEYNGTFEVTVVDADEFEYEVTGSPATPATGTLKYGNSFTSVDCYMGAQPTPGTVSVGVDPAGVGDGTTRSVSSITRSGSTATATSTAHGYETGQSVRIAGAGQAEYNGVQTITVTGPDTFTYAVTGTPATPATGTLTAARGVAPTVANESTAPAGVTFSAPTTQVDAITLLKLRPQESAAVWLRRVIPQRNTTGNTDSVALPVFAAYV